MIIQVNADYEELFERSFHLLAKYQKEIEQEVEKKEQNSILDKVQNKIQGYIFSETPERVFLHETVATTIINISFNDDPPLKQKFTVFIFNDIILFTKRNKQVLNSIRDVSYKVIWYFYEIINIIDIGRTML